MASLLSFPVIISALELGCIYALVALALFLSYSILNIADLSTDGCFTLGCAVGAQVAIMGHGSRCVFRLHYGISADKTRCGIDSGRNYRKYRTLHRESCSNGLLIEPFFI